MKPLTVDDIDQYLLNDTFRLQPKDFGKKYPKWPGAVGLEIEMLGLKSSDQQVPPLAPLYGPEGSVESACIQVAAKQKWRTETMDVQGHDRLSRALLESGDNLTFEPGGQYEISTAPYPCLVDASRQLTVIQKIMDQEFASQNLETLQVGINPWHGVEEIGLPMAKSRYLAMDRYYQSVGEYGRRMMRQTMTVQVNLDFGPTHETLAQRYLASQLLSPYATAIFAFSPFVDGQLSPFQSFRSQIWRHADPTHTGLVGVEALAEDLTQQRCIQVFRDFVLDAQVIFLESKGYQAVPKGVTLRSWMDEGMDGTRPTMADLKSHLSLMFPEVRPRGFLELRSVDCQARVFQCVPAMFYIGLLYDQEALEKVLTYLIPRAKTSHETLKQAAYGLSSEELAQDAAKIYQWALEGFLKLPRCFKEDDADKIMQAFYDIFTSQGLTPASSLIAAVKKDGLALSTFRKLDDDWIKRVTK